MDVFFPLFILAYPEDVDKWMNILFVVVLAVFWVLRGLFREKIKEPDSKPTNQKQPSRKPVQRSSERARALWEQFLEQTRQPSESPSGKSDSREASPVSKQSAFIHTPENILKSKESLPSFNIPPSKSSIPDDLYLNIKRFPESTDISADDLIAESSLISPEISDEEYFPDLLIDYADSEELRRAILHYEILGKPLSLRTLPDDF
jgi:hypothetical protein